MAVPSLEDVDRGIILLLRQRVRKCGWGRLTPEIDSKLRLIRVRRPECVSALVRAPEVLARS